MTTPDKLLSTTPVMILAGGLGTRLRSVLPNLPKGLAPIGDEPFLQIQIELLRAQGAGDFVLCVGHLAAQIHSWFGDGERWGVRIHYSIEGERLLGTAGALKRAARYFEPRALVLNGDTYLAIDYERLLQHHQHEQRRSNALATLSLARASDGSRYGTVLLDPLGEYLRGFKEKAASTSDSEQWLNAGAYVIEQELLESIPSDGVASLERDVLPRVLAEGKKVAALKCLEAFYDIGTAHDLAKFKDYYRHLPKLAAGNALAE